MSAAHCPRCGHISPYAAEVCLMCGAELPPDTQRYSTSGANQESASPQAEDVPPFSSVRHFDFGFTFGETFKIFWNNLWLITKLVFFLFAPLEVFKALSISRAGQAWQAALGTAILTLVAQALIAPSLIYALTTVIRTGTAPTLTDSYRWGLSRLGKYSLSVLMMWALIAAGMVLLIVPGIIASVGLALVYPIATLENVGPVETLKRSWNLTEGNRLSMFLLFVVVGILCSLIAWPLSAVAAVFMIFEARTWPLEALAAVVIDIVNEVTTVLTLVMYLTILGSRKARLAEER